MWEDNISYYVLAESYALVEWAKVGESAWSVVPTVLWAVGSAALAHRLLSALFRRFLFRRVPFWELILQVDDLVPTVLWAPAVGSAALAHRLLSALFRRFLFRRVPFWELILQNLLFLWMVIYSLHFWALLVRVIKIIASYCAENEWDLFFQDQVSYETGGDKALPQWAIWVCGAMPLAFYIHTRPRPEHPPLMIWITTSPWQRREMGAYGYYLSRPLTSLQSSTNMSPRQQAMATRRAYSDSKIMKETVKKKRHSKSV